METPFLWWKLHANNQSPKALQGKVNQDNFFLWGLIGFNYNNLLKVTFLRNFGRKERKKCQYSYIF